MQNDNPDLFYSIPWSYGTLGFLVAAEIKIVPAKKFVKIDYMPVHTHQDILSTFKRETEKSSGNEFVEGLVYSLDEAVIMTSNMTDEAEPAKVSLVLGMWFSPCIQFSSLFVPPVGLLHSSDTKEREQSTLIIYKGHGC